MQLVLKNLLKYDKKALDNHDSPNKRMCGENICQL